MHHVRKPPVRSVLKYPLPSPLFPQGGAASWSGSGAGGWLADLQTHGPHAYAFLSLPLLEQDDGSAFLQLSSWKGGLRAAWSPPLLPMSFPAALSLPLCSLIILLGFCSSAAGFRTQVMRTLYERIQGQLRQSSLSFCFAPNLNQEIKLLVELKDLNWS